MQTSKKSKVIMNLQFLNPDLLNKYATIFKQVTVQLQLQCMVYAYRD